MKKMKLKFLLFIFIFVLTLSSCSPSGTDLTGFLKPPQTSKEMQVLQDAIKKIVKDTSSMLFPRSGDYKNTMVLKDIDKDEIDEALIFYSSNDDKKLAHILILKMVRGQWVTFADIEGEGNNIDIIDFNDYNSDGRLELICGFGILSSEIKVLSIYSLFESSPKELLTMRYSSIFITEIAKDKPFGILTIINSTNKTNNLTAFTAQFILAKDNLPFVVSECPLNSVPKSFLSLAYGNFNNDNAFYIDEKIDDTYIKTEILSWDGNQLLNISSNIEKSISDENLKRANNILCQDIDANGLIEIPKSAIFVEKQAIISAENIKAIEWVNFNGLTFEHNFYCISNLNERYYIIVPQNWLGSVFAKKDALINGINFYFKKDTVENNELLFSVFAFNKAEWEEKMNINGFSLIKEQSDRIYAVKYETSNSEKARLFIPTVDEIRKLFVQTAIKQN